jgi:cytochrome c-type biogenesis protein CcmH
MNRKNIFTKLILILLSIVTSYLLLPTPYSLLPTPAFAQEESNYDRINEIAKQLNCPTCAGLNLADCRTKTCEQWREQIGDFIEEGRSNQEILDYFTARFGDQVLQEPPKRGFSLVLWILPVVALVAGGAWLAYIMRGWSKRRTVSATVNTSSPQPSPDAPSHEDDFLSQVEQDLGLD